MNIALRKRKLSPVRLALEDSSKSGFLLFAVVSFQMEGSMIKSNLSKKKRKAYFVPRYLNVNVTAFNLLILGI